MANPQIVINSQFTRKWYQGPAVHPSWAPSQGSGILLSSSALCHQGPPLTIPPSWDRHLRLSLLAPEARGLHWSCPLVTPPSSHSIAKVMSPPWSGEDPSSQTWGTPPAFSMLACQECLQHCSRSYHLRVPGVLENQVGQLLEMSVGRKEVDRPCGLGRLAWRGTGRPWQGPHLNSGWN